MPRSSAPWFRSSSNAWYITHNGRKTSLGVQGKGNRKAAVDAWHRLFAQEPERKPTPVPKRPDPPEPTPEPQVTVQAVVDAFLADADGRLKAKTALDYRRFLTPFAEQHGEEPAESLTPAQAENYCRKPEWSATTRHGFLSALVTAFRWAERQRLITRNPLVGIRKPPKASRGAKVLVSEETHQLLLKHATSEFRAFLQLLWLTGARPGEIAGLTADAVDLSNGVALISEHKCAHLGKSRTVFLCPEAVHILQPLVKQKPQGLLFTAEDGGRMNANIISNRLKRLAKRAGVKATAYGYRHTFATDALANGLPDATVAALLGHSSTAMLHKHYAHLTAKAQAMREALGSVR